MMRTADDRRNADARAKREARAKLKRSLFIDEEPSARTVGRQATQHNTCPCWMCTMPDKEPKRRIERDLRKFFGEVK